MGAVIVLIIVALLGAYAGSRFERSRAATITKRDAEALMRSIGQMRAIYESHHDVHKILKYDIEVLARDITTIAAVVGIKRVVPQHNA